MDDNQSFEKVAYKYYCDMWFRSHVENGEVSFNDVMEFASACCKTGGKAEDILHDIGICGKAPRRFEEFLNDEIRDEDMMVDILPEKVFKRWQEYDMDRDREEAVPAY